MASLNEKMQKALNDQINAELYASYLYLSMSAYFEDIDLPGFAAWMEAQSQEETGHVMRIYKFIIERNGRVILQAIDAPPSEWASPLAAFEAAYGHEVKVTGMINKLVDTAIQEGDHASKSFLDWFVNEQVEEEASVDEVVQKLKLIGDFSYGLLMLGNELAQRQPADLTGEAGGEAAG